mmetsp:Transcript_91737/g.255520  ORF Transcript_91737/g.255520 Transcript_91737/m.255520 type:complete len:211 (+) Transcript_91737:648-1280(+)
MSPEPGIGCASEGAVYVVLPQQHLLHGPVALEPLAKLFLPVNLRRQLLQEDLAVPVAGPNVRPLGHRQLVDEESSAHGAEARHLLRHVLRPEQFGLDCALLHGIAVPDLVVVELLRCHGHLPGVPQLDARCPAYGIFHDLHGLDASVDRKDLPDLLLAPAVGETLDEDARAHGVVWDYLLFWVLVVLLLRCSCRCRLRAGLLLGHMLLWW